MKLNWSKLVVPVLLAPLLLSGCGGQQKAKADSNSDSGAFEVISEQTDSSGSFSTTTQVLRDKQTHVEYIRSTVEEESGSGTRISTSVAPRIKGSGSGTYYVQDND